MGRVTVCRSLLSFGTRWVCPNDYVDLAEPQLRRFNLSGINAHSPEDSQKLSGPGVFLIFAED